MKKHGLLFVNGEVTEKEVGIIRHRTFDKIIAADGGVHHALRFGFTPDVVVGDLDSITETVRAQLPGTQFVHRPSQELNDLEKTLQFCQEHGFFQLTILGIAGKRLDHTINNFSVLARYDRFFELELYDAYARIYLIRDEIQIQGQEGQLVSLIPVGKVEGITTEGLAFPLNNESLEFGVREGLSNYLTRKQARVRFRKGLLLVFVHYAE